MQNLNIKTIIFFSIVLLMIIYLYYKKQEDFTFKTPSLLYDTNACNRRCDNTIGCNSSYYNPETRQCYMNSLYKNSDLYYPYKNNTIWWSPSKYRWGRNLQQ